MALPQTRVRTSNEGWIYSDSWPINEAFAITLPVRGSAYGSDVYVLTHALSGHLLAVGKDGETLAWIGEEMWTRFPQVWALLWPPDSPLYWSAIRSLQGVGLTCNQDTTDGVLLGEQWGGS